MKKILSILLIGMLSFGMVGCESPKEDASNSTVENEIKHEESKKEEAKTNRELKIHFIDVGQADAILIQQGSENMIIDAGNNEDEGILKSYLSDQGIKELKYVVGTHAHEDHIGSMDYIINSFKVGKVYFPKQTATTKTFENFVGSVKNKGMQLTVPKVGETFKLGEANCTILGPVGSKYEDANDYSIVLKVEFGENSFMLTGDAEAVSEMEMVKGGTNLKADLLKIGHHGSKSSTCSNFLSAVNPKYAVISVGKDNSYKHPSQSTMDRLKEKGVQVYRTDENGTIVVTSDGKNISFNSSPGTYIGFDDKSSNKANSDSNSTNVAKNSSGSSNLTTTPAPDPAPKPAPNPPSQNSGVMVWLSETGSKYHRINNCGKMNPNKARQVTLDEAKNGYGPCSKCNPPQ